MPYDRKHIDEVREKSNLIELLTLTAKNKSGFDSSLTVATVPFGSTSSNSTTLAAAMPYSFVLYDKPYKKKVYQININ